VFSSIKMWWARGQRITEQKAAAAADTARQNDAAMVNYLRSLTDDELIAAAEARTSMSHPYHEMEMQRRLKDAILAQISESRKGRIWGAWGAAAIAMLTAVLIVLTVVLIKRGG
jgi:hypothetical protein